MSAPELRGARVVLRAPRAGDAPELTRLHRIPDVARWWGAPDPAFPFEADLEGWAITLDDAPVGWIQVWEEREPAFRHAALDLFVDPARHRRGIATEAITLVRDHLVGVRGHHRLTIDPAAANTAAIACYEALGFVRVGVLRAAWRDPAGAWQDGLLLDWVAPGTP